VNALLDGIYKLVQSYITTTPTSVLDDDDVNFDNNNNAAPLNVHNAPRDRLIYAANAFDEEDPDEELYAFKPEEPILLPISAPVERPIISDDRPVIRDDRPVIKGTVEIVDPYDYKDYEQEDEQEEPFDAIESLRKGDEHFHK